MTVGEHAQNVALALGELSDLRRRGRAGDDAGEHRVNISTPIGDQLHRTHYLGQWRLLGDEATSPRVQRFRQERLLAVGGVQDHVGLRSATGAATSDLDSTQARHPQVEQGDPRLLLLYCSQSLIAVTRLRGNFDPACDQDLGHRLHDGGMVICH